MSALLNFAFEENLVRVVEENGEPWFVATDIAKALNFRNASDAIRSVPDAEKGTHKMRTLGGDQALITINEPGLYRLVFRSNKPEAERFQNFVFHDVLPQIRRTGKYDPEANRPAPPAAFEIDVQHAPLSAKTEYLRLVAKLRGREAAVAMMPHIGLPDLDVVLAGTRVMPGGNECLAHLLNWRDEEGATVEALICYAMGENSTPYQKRLALCGVRAVAAGEPGILVATSTRPVMKVFEGTLWANGAHTSALRGLEGTTSSNPVKFDGISSRTLFIPARHLSGA